FAEDAREVFSALADPSADARAHLAPAPPHLLDKPLGAARAQLHETYIVAETKNGLVIVDQHAAHERLGYEKLKAAMERDGLSRQLLLVPAVVELDPSDAAALVERAGELMKMGLVIEAFGAGAVLVREAPALLGELDIVRLVRDLAEHMAEWDAALPLERRVFAGGPSVFRHRSA